ncbi:GntR family transcriptional regulator [Spinactinospora alkalitolerans]|uniref:GntR family transcriptional regulator n=1 Tax=Spinactinospora alkalitolerans TaxID=687207 RepID=A0A852TS11_9ACTN|nr:GntR family transcriptional regulator [Spinactinospora alkalitolerans]NYE46335.1 GntR family transcriptional regulator [Spinactinospora alkalitolerans]
MTAKDGERKYERVARVIRERIASGAYRPGNALPSEGRLSQEFEVSRPTVINALDVLRDEGLIYTQTGSGSYVRGTAPKATEELSRPGLELLEGSEEAQSAELLQAGIVVASPRAANLLELPTPVKAFLRQYVISDEDGPTELVSAWFPLELASGTRFTSAEPLGPSIRRHLFERKRIRLDHAVERTIARAATSEEAQALGITPGSAVLNIVVTGHDADGKALQLIDAVLPGDRHELRDVYPLN